MRETDPSGRPGDGDETRELELARPPYERGDGIAPAQRAALVVMAHPRPFLLGRCYDLPSAATIVVGRALDADVSLPELSVVSRRHARLTRDAAGATIEDLGSRNGTFVNGSRVEGAARLASGDRVQIGAATLRYLEGEHLEQQLFATLYDRAVRDELTGAYNRLRLDEEIARCIAMARRHHRPSALILLDVDALAAVNQGQGHPHGDLVLQQLVELVAPHLRREAIFARLGADEFAILCPETALSGAQVFADRLRQVVAAHAFGRADARTSITCSFAVAELSGEEDGTAAVYRLADEALQRAKAAGGNRVEDANAVAAVIAEPT